MINQTKLTFIAILTCTAQITLAQFATTGFDIKPQSVSSGMIATGAHDDDTGAEITNVQTYGYFFSNPDDPYFDQDPGINAATGSGLQSVQSPGSTGPVISFNILSSLTYWNGIGPVTQTATPDDESLVYNLAKSYTTVDSSSAAQSGFNIASVNNSNGTFHRHLNAYLFGNHADPSDPTYPIPSNPIPAAPGIYFVTLTVVDTGNLGTAVTQPLYMIYDNGASVAAEEQAKTYIRNVYASLTNIPVAEENEAYAANTPSAWNSKSSGTWDNSAFWTGSVPSAEADVAVFGQAITSPVTITLATPRTIGHLAFDNANGYTLTGAILTLGDGSAPADVVVNSGSHTISAPVHLASDTTFTIVPSSSTLTISSPITSESGIRVAKEGAGSLLTPQLTADNLDVVQGTVRLTSNPSALPTLLHGLTIRSGASFDLSNNSLILDQSTTADVITELTQIRQSLQSHQLYSSTADADAQHRLAIGYADNSLLGASTWDGTPIDSTTILTKLTYLGDANLDGKVNADDYALIDKGYARQLSSWTFGDFNYDGVVNQQDYLLIDRVFAQQIGVLSPSLLEQRESQFGAVYVTELLSTLPEPSCVAGLIAIAALLRRRHRASCMD